MSGGDFSAPSGSGSVSFESDCASLFEKTVLNSPDPIILAQLKKGDILSVEILPRGTKKVLVALTANGKPAGSITSAALAKIISCIENETFSFAAEVVDIHGGACTVFIRPEAR
jgi:hypothetical protein